MNPLFFLPSPARPSRLRPRWAPPFPSSRLHRRIRRGQSEKCLVAIASSYSLTPSSGIVSSTVLAVGLHSTMTLANCLASRPPVTCSRDGLRCKHHCYLPLTLVNESILPPYVSAMVGNGASNPLTGCLTNTSAFANLHRGWFCGVRGLAPAHIALRQG